MFMELRVLILMALYNLQLMIALFWLTKWKLNQRTTDYQVDIYLLGDTTVDFAKKYHISACVANVAMLIVYIYEKNWFPLRNMSYLLEIRRKYLQFSYVIH